MQYDQDLFLDGIFGPVKISYREKINRYFALIQSGDYIHTIGHGEHRQQALDDLYDIIVKTQAREELSKALNEK